MPNLSTIFETPALAPLKLPVFRMLWLAWAAANLTMWMNDVAVAWLMTSLTTNPALVALVQTASTLPVFLLGLPSGAMADIVDRRLYFAGTQLWVACNALLLALLSLLHLLNAPLLLVLTFVNGVGLAMRWPVFAAIVPELVDRPRLPAALALNGIAMNLSRVIGPVLSGTLLASLGSAAVFVLNTVLAGVSFTLILRWRHRKKTSALPGERFVGAMRVGLQHVMQSPRMKVVILRVFLFFLQSTGLTALLPLIARRLHGGGPAMFTVMLACLGLGAITAALYFPKWRARFDRDQFIRVATIGHGVVSLAVIFAPNIWLALPGMFVAGMCWISAANSLTVSAQMALPDWVRARGMSAYQMALMGGSAAGSFFWGQIAAVTSIPVAIGAAAGFGIVVLLATRRLTIEGGDETEDLSPALPAAMPDASLVDDPEAGPVMVQVEYRIDTRRAEDFAEVMRATRQGRLRQGALSWGLFRDPSDPGRYVEYFVDENWTEHLRRMERFTAADVDLRGRRLGFHLGVEPPKVTRWVGETIGR